MGVPWGAVGMSLDGPKMATSNVHHEIAPTWACGNLMYRMTQGDKGSETRRTELCTRIVMDKHV